MFTFVWHQFCAFWTKILATAKKCARWIPHFLSTEQKQVRVRFCRFFLEWFKNGRSKNLQYIITGDETWVYSLDPESKLQSMVWSRKGAPPPTKLRRQRTTKKTMFAIFFGFRGVVASIPLPERSTVTATWYTNECLPIVFENILKGHPETELRRYFLHHDNAPAHRAALTTAFLDGSGIKLLQHPPYSPDLAPCDFWLFPKIKEKLKRKEFIDREHQQRGWWSPRISAKSGVQKLLW